MARRLSLGHTPDADDAFMFYGFASGGIATPGFEIEHVIEDIESLNKRALNHELDVTAISAHAYAYLHDYTILRSGSSFGIDYGPIVISKRGSDLAIDNLANKTIAIPGKLTSANLLLQLAIGEFAFKEMSFEKIPDAVRSGEADAGLVIHEAQITYDKREFEALLDLGKWWTVETRALPVPLGINVASNRTMAAEEISVFSDLFAKSIAFGLDNIDAAVGYAMRYARDQPKETITKFVKMYVNDFTRDMGARGRESLIRFFDLAYGRGLLKEQPKVRVV